MAVITINGVPLPAPADLSFGISDISNAERNARGKIIIERIRGGVRKLQLSWSYLSPADLSQVLNAVSPVSFSVTYLDPIANASRTAIFYSGDRSCGVIDYRSGVPRYKDVKFNLIEV